MIAPGCTSKAGRVMLVRNLKITSGDKRLNRSIPYIQHTCEYKNSIVLWVILQNNAGWDCFKTPTLREILRTQELRQVEHCAFLAVTHLFQ